MTQIDRNQLPNVLIIGAGKAGTSSLHYYLDQHPEIAMSAIKETYFFQRADYAQALQDYARHFSPEARVRGESTPSYTQYPRVKQIPERIHAVVPDAKLIYLVRDPVERAVSHYHQRFSVGDESRAIEEAFADVDDPYNVYVCCSRYALQIDRYMEYFPKESLLVVDHRALQERRQDTLADVFKFLDVDSGFTSPQFDNRLNTRDELTRLSDIGQRLRASPLTAGARHLLPAGARAGMFDFAKRRLSKPVTRSHLSDASRARLAEVLREDVNRLRAFTGEAFDHWSV